jgi:hypothetical protein
MSGGIRTWHFEGDISLNLNLPLNFIVQMLCEIVLTK